MRAFGKSFVDFVVEIQDFVVRCDYHRGKKLAKLIIVEF